MMAVAQSTPFEILEQQRALVSQLQFRFDKARTELEQAQIALQGMEKIFEALPTRRRGTSTVHPDVKPDVARQSGSSGRQPGAISMRWRSILEALYREGKPFAPVRVAEVVKELENRVMKPSEAKRILEGYVDHGYVQKVDWNDFEVTPDAAKKFDFQGGIDFDQILGGDPPPSEDQPPTEAVARDPLFPTLPAAPTAPGSQARHG